MVRVAMNYRFSYRVYRKALRNPLRTAHGVWSEREGVLLRLEDSNGKVGIGEAAPIDWFGMESCASVVARCQGWGDRIDDDLIAAVPTAYGSLRFALAMARSSRPDGATPARIPMTALLPAGRLAVAQLGARLEGGWLTFKWKVGVGPIDAELGVLDELLAELPAYARLRLDANGAWNRRQAQRWLQRCAERPVEFVEQPLAPVDEAGLRGLADDFPVPLALDESVVGLEQAQRWQAEGWKGVFVIKPALAGPLDDLLAWVRRTRADVVLSSAIESAAARAAILAHALVHADVLLKRAPGFGIGEVFGERLWDGPVMGPALDAAWVQGVNTEELWNAAS